MDLKRLRKSKKLTQIQAAEGIGIAVCTLSFLESGDRKEGFPLHMRERFCEFYKISREELETIWQATLAINAIKTQGAEKPRLPIEGEVIPISIEEMGKLEGVDLEKIEEENEDYIRFCEGEDN